MLDKKDFEKKESVCCGSKVGLVNDNQSVICCACHSFLQPSDLLDVSLPQIVKDAFIEGSCSSGFINPDNG